jgi:protein O-GlcNAc transferase
MLNFGPAASSKSVAQVFGEAVTQHQAGRYAQAEPLYRQVLAAVPAHAEALHMLGLLAAQVGKPEAGLELIERAVALNPGNAVYRGNWAEVLRQARQLPRAEAEFRRALELDPRFGDAYTNFALLLLLQGREREAAEILQAGIGHVPGHGPLYRFLGDALVKLKRFGEALAAYEQAARMLPQVADVRFNMGAMLAELGRCAEAEAAFRAAVALAPEDWDAYEHLAEMMARQERTADAVAVLQQVAARQPQRAKTHYQLGNTLRNIHRVDEAIAAYERCLQITPEDHLALANLALAYRDQARLEESVALHRRALELAPEAAAVHSSLIFTMHLLPHVARGAIELEQAKWNERYEAPLADKIVPHKNERRADKRLRVGFVSADWRAHPVGWFMLPLLKNLDREQVEVFCYSVVRVPDALTAALTAAADVWRHATFLDNDELAAQVRADGIDILIDLSNHTIDNRMPLFARKPAPVQMTYLAYCAGTGLRTMHWRLTDPFIDPPPPPGCATEAAPAPAFERPLRLAETYWCYGAHPAAGAVTELPALRNGYVTLGSFNYFSKCNDQVLQVWARLLRETAGARLLLHVPAGSREQYVRQMFEREGVARERLELVPRCRESDYFQHYEKVDVALDPFPWAGGTTTCDALWMGVPVVTLVEEGAGADTVSRGGLSILTNLGHPEWVAHTEEEYVAKAIALAGDVGRLAELRRGLRPRMQGSVLMDGPRFARRMQEALRRAWGEWCGRG